MTGITESDLRHILMRWPVVPPLEIEPIATGTNNRSFLIMSGTGAYVLKRYQNEAIQERLRFEHTLLGALAAAELPFAVPAPLRSRSGDTSVEVRHDGVVSRFALFPLIPGRAAVFGNESAAVRCGEALALLHRALDALRLDPAVPLPETFGDLSTVHAAVPDPFAAIQRAFRNQGLAMNLATIVARAEERWQSSTAGWGIQLIHSDFYASNVMMDAGRVSGILDFEFSGLGYRSMDFAIGLAAFSTKGWDDGCSWPLVESFATGYLRRVPLADEELNAIPDLLRMREATSLVHWLGRLEQSLTTPNDLHARAHRLLALDRWLEAHQSELVNLLRRRALR